MLRVETSDFDDLKQFKQIEPTTDGSEFLKRLVVADPSIRRHLTTQGIPDYFRWSSGLGGLTTYYEFYYIDTQTKYRFLEKPLNPRLRGISTTVPRRSDFTNEECALLGVEKITSKSKENKGEQSQRHSVTAKATHTPPDSVIGDSASPTEESTAEESGIEEAEVGLSFPVEGTKTGSSYDDSKKGLGIQPSKTVKILIASGLATSFDRIRQDGGTIKFITRKADTIIEIVGSEVEVFEVSASSIVEKPLSQQECAQSQLPKVAEAIDVQAALWVKREINNHCHSSAGASEEVFSNRSYAVFIESLQDRIAIGLKVSPAPD